MSFWSKRDKPCEKYANLLEALEAVDLEAVKGFIESGVQVNRPVDSRGAFPLHLEIARGSLLVAEYLINNGADVDMFVDGGGTPLMTAATSLQFQLLEFLLNQGANPNKSGVDGRFPLVCIFRGGNPDTQDQLKCIRFLVSHGADVNQRTEQGGTALMYAASFGNTDAVKELLDLGADPALRDNDGETAAIWAFNRAHDELAGMLKRRADTN